MTIYWDYVLFRLSSDLAGTIVKIITKTSDEKSYIKNSHESKNVKIMTKNEKSLKSLKCVKLTVLKKKPMFTTNILALIITKLTMTIKEKEKENETKVDIKRTVINPCVTITVTKKTEK